MRSLRNASFVVLLGLVVAFGPGLTAAPTAGQVTRDSICDEVSCDCDFDNHTIICEYYPYYEDFCSDAYLSCRDYICGQMLYFNCDHPEWPLQDATCVCADGGRR